MRCACVAIVLTSALGAYGQEDGFASLFSDPQLSQWSRIGADSWSYEDGVIHCSGQGSGWLRSVRAYEDFTLRLDFRIVEGGNSGVFVRVPLLGRQSATGMEIQLMGATVDPPDVSSCGAIYDCVAPTVDATRPAGEWNELEVRCIGPQVKTTLNGQVLYDVNLDACPADDAIPVGRRLRERLRRGYIGLQNHGNEVWFRSVRIRAEAEDGVASLLNGRDLTGWQTGAASGWKAEGPSLVHDGAEAALIEIAQPYRNYVLRYEFRFQPGAQAGVHLRRTDATSPIVISLAGGPDGALSPNSPGGLRGGGAPSQAALLPTGEWNDMEVTYEGCHVTVRLNAVKVFEGSVYEYSGYYRPPMEGHIAFEAGGHVELRSIRVRSLPDSRGLA